jgi:hypothetical protein
MPEPTVMAPRVCPTLVDLPSCRRPGAENGNHEMKCESDRLPILNLSDVCRSSTRILVTTSRPVIAMEGCGHPRLRLVIDLATEVVGQGTTVVWAQLDQAVAVVTTTPSASRAAMLWVAVCGTWTDPRYRRRLLPIQRPTARRVLAWSRPAHCADRLGRGVGDCYQCVDVSIAGADRLAQSPP